MCLCTDRVERLGLRAEAGRGDVRSASGTDLVRLRLAHHNTIGGHMRPGLLN